MTHNHQQETLSLVVWGQTNVGIVRGNNEDAFVVADLKTGHKAVPDTLFVTPVSRVGVLLAVSDGMGGASAGEVASQLVVDALEYELSASRDEVVQHALKDAVEKANQLVWETSRQQDLKGMGATLVAIVISGTDAHVASVGDSRVYLIRGTAIWQVTKDQSYVEMLVDSGAMTREQAEQSRFRNVILQAMGQSPEINVAQDKIELQSGDVLLLCSDGLSGKVRSEEMCQSVLSHA